MAIGISFGGAFTGDTMAFGRTSWGAPVGMGTLWTMGTGPLFSIPSSRLLLDPDESLPESSPPSPSSSSSSSSSEPLLLEELELASVWPADCPPLPPVPVESTTDRLFPVSLAVTVGTAGSVVARGLARGGTGMDARIAAVDDG